LVRFHYLIAADHGLSVVQVLDEMDGIAALKYRRESHMLAALLTDEETARVKLEPFWELKLLEINKVANLLVSSRASLVGKALDCRRMPTPNM
jgi:hypothetical protein